MNPVGADHWEVVVVGGSAAGLSAALTLGRARRRTLVLDTGTPRNRFADHMHGVLGNEGVSPEDLIGRGRAECSSYGVVFDDVEVQTVREAPRTPDGGPQRLQVELTDGRHLETRALIAASGVTDLLPEVPGLAPRWGKTVAHCPYCHGLEFADGRIGVLGFSPAGLHQAELLRQWTDQLTLFSAGMGELDLEQVLRLESRGVAIEPSPVEQIRGEPDGVAEVVLANSETHEFDALFTASQMRPNDSYLDELALERNDSPFGGNYIAADATGKTSHQQVWVAGNINQAPANVSISIAAGSYAGGMCNLALTSEDFDIAQEL
ncbi:NAD(P)/FAD-dependent oxidoreductase [Nesterenkonia haasae]|uniref:NAD(P)/FAD-dependent oxidoreductase n=1 Tax=Nesterenkonia haasae TaxID=2587813 RepID=UPI00139152FE|nr:NAD(P)/FAD-dependent oxidoreductase [Nesterenkonia haasae]NDK33140.1 NAD(P)/FAD-dependent oxidoreductase [Nesterenkonia haasae]